MKLKPNIATSEAGFVFNPATGDSFAASPLAAEILALLRAGEPEAVIVASLLARYDVPEAQLRRDLADFMAQLRTFQLLEPAA
ncbi:HPr-rel-A system PqqD family peptide chaperone [Hymenobacter cheonanensis]|uniref:HPr-rel-A system PqqD family peptide chaperone n=1 Tax=Hymenobacter sp. CA2-7 TaxID=3063993 RepID=UPI0027143FF5|nr:HPr-rel-A system PqqD family peptide chaperone [Hymenobacter sp. CA2-7]MDO7884902.1 HPr-rel-A system PqqD family peptide chaperone [Hymenobacter sp. CA2-7]